jgi:hypothetical protein
MKMMWKFPTIQPCEVIRMVTARRSFEGVFAKVDLA